MRVKRLGVAVACWALLCAGCDDRGGQREELSAIEELELQAAQLAVQLGCTSVEQCKTVPVGEKACGGPRYHLVYCASSTNEPELQRVLEELQQREQEYNQRYDPVSTCRLILPPEVELVGDVCLREQS